MRSRCIMIKVFCFGADSRGKLGTKANKEVDDNYIFSAEYLLT